MTKTVKIVLGGATALFVLLMIAVSCSQPSSPSATAPPSAYVPYTSQRPTERAADPTTEAPEPVPSGPLTTFDNGTYMVGTGDNEIKPGKYRSPSPTDRSIKMCYFDVMSPDNHYLDQGVTPEGPSLVTLKTGNKFESSGCETWVKVG